MKNAIITIAIVLGMAVGAFAQEESTGRTGLLGFGESFYDRDRGVFSVMEKSDIEYTDGQDRANDYTQGSYQGEGGLFGKGDGSFWRGTGLSSPYAPGIYGSGNSQDANSPLGSGVALLAGLGAAYLAAKRRKEE